MSGSEAARGSLQSVGSPNPEADLQRLQPVEASDRKLGLLHTAEVPVYQLSVVEIS